MLFSTDPAEVAENRGGRLSQRQRSLVRRSRWRERRGTAKWAGISIGAAAALGLFVGLSGGYEGSDDVGRPAEIGGIPSGRVGLATALMAGAVALWWIVFLGIATFQGRAERRLNVQVGEGSVEVAGSLDAPSVLVRVGGAGGVSGFVPSDVARQLDALGRIRVYYIGRRTLADFLSAEPSRSAHEPP